MLAPLLLLAFAASSSTTPSPPPPAPPCSTSEYRAMDFWVGEWDLSFAQTNGQTGHAVNRITKDEFGPCVISEHFDQAAIGFIGTSHSTYDSLRKQWVQTWIDNQGGYITLAGGPTEGRPWSFELATLEPRGPAGNHFRMIWEDVKPDSLTWRWQQRQADGSYRDSWVIRYQRRK